ncbi:hypothetical protein ACWD4O_02915 [Streptomyces sp. NPDC002623]
MTATMALTVLPEDMDRDDPAWELMCRELQNMLEADSEVDVKVPPVRDAGVDAKGDPITIGVLIVMLAGTPAVTRAVGAINEWVHMLGERRAKIQIDIGKKKFTANTQGYSAKDVQKIIESARVDQG